MHFPTLIGLAAAFSTTISYFPQLKKCWDTGSAGDLSLKMFLILAIGIALWVVYGWLQADLVIILANSVSFVLLIGILWLHSNRGSRRRSDRPKVHLLVRLHSGSKRNYGSSF
jgi:MtN3 and saliva related transmembrane protein